MTETLYKPTEVELLNPRASFSQRSGVSYRVSFEVSRELWTLFESPQPGLRLRGIIWQADDDEADQKVVEEAKKKAKKKPEPKGPYSMFWNHIIGKHFFVIPGVVHIFECLGAADEAGMKQVLCEQFKTNTRSTISPEQLKLWLKERGREFNAPIDGPLSLIEQAERSV